MELCFAYGSNTDAQDWAAWCRRTGHDPACIERIGTALLPDLALAFDYWSTTRGGGALNLRERVGGVVAGVLLRADDAGWAALDVKEGVAARHYQRARRVAILPDGSGVPATTYEVTPERRDGFHPPTPAYLDAVRRGYHDHGIDPASLEAAATGQDAAALAEVFAYGTLRRGECRFSAMVDAGATAVTATSTAGRLHDFGAHPAMVLAAGVVAGEVMTLADPARSLPLLDIIEEAAPRGGFGGLYRRTIIRTALGAQAWAYVMNPAQVAGTPVITSGDWCRRTGRTDEGHGGPGRPSFDGPPVSV